MTLLVTGSSGHLGEAMVRHWRQHHRPVVGVDIKPGPCTDHVGSLCDADWLDEHIRTATQIVHTATLHKPHVATHTRQQFIDTNVSGTLNTLEAAQRHGIDSVVFTSTTSTFGDAMRPAANRPAVWVDETLVPQPRNIYGVTKCAAEDLCALFWRNYKLPCLVLRTSRFFPEEDDNRSQRERYSDENLKVLELLHRRVDIADVVQAHECALQRAKDIGFARYIISAPTPFKTEDATALRSEFARVLEQRVPGACATFNAQNWHLPASLDRVYDSRRACQELGWQPHYTFAHAIDALQRQRDWRSELTHQVGRKGYHDQVFDDGPFPVEDHD